MTQHLSDRPSKATRKARACLWAQFVDNEVNRSDLPDQINMNRQLIDLLHKRNGFHIEELSKLSTYELIQLAGTKELFHK